MSFAPERPLVLATAGLAAATAAALVVAAPLFLVVAAAMALAVAAFLDLLALRRFPVPVVEREAPAILPIGENRPIVLHLAAPSARRVLKLSIHDHHPASCAASGLPLHLDLPPGQSATLQYRLQALQRGSFTFGPLEIRLASPLGLWRRQERLAAPAALRVYPDYAEVVRFGLLAAERRLGQIGIHRIRQRGEGSDFRQLREFRQGDRLAAVDWKATARHGKPIARDYQADRDQTLLLLLDTGRRMGGASGSISHFDHCLNSCLLLAAVASRQGDAVGLMSFAGDKDRWLPPSKSGGAVAGQLLESLFEIYPSDLAPDYLETARRCLVLQRKRALVVMVTNVRDDDLGELGPALSLLSRRHRVLLVQLREDEVERRAASPAESLEESLEWSASIDFLQRQEEALARLPIAVERLASTPQELPGRLASTYLALKAAGKL